jgi:hypothetical protein
VEVCFTVHAEERMAERDVTKDEVLRVLEDPELDLPGQGQSRKLYRHVEGRPLSIEFIGARECPIWAAARVFEEFGLTVAPSDLLAS